MLKDINDSDADARELVRLLAGIPAKINLIPFNPWPGTNYDCSSSSRIEKFADIVNKAGYGLARPHPARPRHLCRQRSAEERHRAPHQKDRDALTA